MDYPLIVASVGMIICGLKVCFEKSCDTRHIISEKTAYFMFFLVGVGGVIMSVEALKKYFIYNIIVGIIMILFFLALIILRISGRRK